MSYLNSENGVEGLGGINIWGEYGEINTPLAHVSVSSTL